MYEVNSNDILRHEKLLGLGFKCDIEDVEMDMNSEVDIQTQTANERLKFKPQRCSTLFINTIDSKDAMQA